LFGHSCAVVYNLWVAGGAGPIGVTARHPVWSADREAWVSAGELRIGERVLVNGGTAAVVRWEYRGEEPVYNLEVDGDHCYRVGEQGLLVHNASAAGPVATTLTPAQVAEFADVARERTSLGLPADATLVKLIISGSTL